jgi:hypothetical protein
LFVGFISLFHYSLAQEMVETNADERERAMGFPIGTTNGPTTAVLIMQSNGLELFDVNCLFGSCSRNTG